MTYFPFPNIARGRPGSGEVGTTAFSVPPGALDYWEQRLAAAGIGDLVRSEGFDEARLNLRGPDGDSLALVEHAGDGRVPWTGGGVDAQMAIRGFHSVSLRLRDAAATEELLVFMGYQEAGTSGDTRRLVLPQGNGADIVDIEVQSGLERGQLGAGSVHHIAFAVADRARQLEARQALVDAGYDVTPVIDRDYFFAVYFRSPGGVLFEIATGEPGFATDEDIATLGASLQLPPQHAHLREKLEASLQPLEEK
jgi:glyoxalase family protein